MAALTQELTQTSQRAAMDEATEHRMKVMQQKTGEALQESRARTASLQQRLNQSENTAANEKGELAQEHHILASQKRTAEAQIGSLQEQLRQASQMTAAEREEELKAGRQVKAFQQKNTELAEELGEQRQEVKALQHKAALAQ